jgi:hypothetical protein
MPSPRYKRGMTLRSLRELDVELSRGVKSLWLVHKPISVGDLEIMTFHKVRLHISRGDFARADKLQKESDHEEAADAADAVHHSGMCEPIA